MKKQTQINNLDQLEKEILRQQLHLREKEGELQNNIEHFRKHFPAYVSGSLSCKAKSNEKRSFMDSLFENNFFSGLTDRAVNRAERLMEKALRRFFGKD